MSLFQVIDGISTARLDSVHLKVTREEVILSGRRRLDVVVRHTETEQVILVLELKMTEAEQADTAKQKQYSEWLDGQDILLGKKILIVVDAVTDEYEGFEVRTWASVCVELRRMVPGLMNRIAPIKIAMILAFVAAVEFNLLGLSCPEQSFSRAQCVRAVSHLKQFQRRLNG